MKNDGASTNCKNTEIQALKTRITQLEEALAQTDGLKQTASEVQIVAHEFNNILSGIVGHAELIRFEVEENDPIQSDLDGIVRNCKRAGELTQILFDSNED